MGERRGARADRAVRLKEMCLDGELEERSGRPTLLDQLAAAVGQRWRRLGIGSFLGISSRIISLQCLHPPHPSGSPGKMPLVNICDDRLPASWTRCLVFRFTLDPRQIHVPVDGLCFRGCINAVVSSYLTIGEHPSLSFRVADGLRLPDAVWPTYCAAIAPRTLVGGDYRELCSRMFELL